MTSRQQARALQLRMATVVEELRTIHAELLELPGDVDSEAVPTIRRAVTDAKHHATVGFYSLGCLVESLTVAPRSDG